MKGQIERYKMEEVVKLEFERVISIAIKTGLIPNQSELDRGGLAYSLYQALLLYIKSLENQQPLKMVSSDYKGGFIEQEP